MDIEALRGSQSKRQELGPARAALRPVGDRMRSVVGDRERERFAGPRLIVRFGALPPSPDPLRMIMPFGWNVYISGVHDSDRSPYFYLRASFRAK